MNKNSNSYQDKILELRHYVELEARALQNVSESKEVIIKDLAELSTKKTTIVKQIAESEKRLVDLEEVFNQTKETERKFVMDVEAELKNKTERLKTTNETLDEVSNKLDASTIALKEIEGFIEKEQDARARWLKEKIKLGVLLNEIEGLEKKFEKQQEANKKEEKKLDSLKIYLTDFYGKIGSYVKTAQETLEHVNKTFEETGVPIKFDIPDSQILNVDINNFEQLR